MTPRSKPILGGGGGGDEVATNRDTVSGR